MGNAKPKKNCLQPRFREFGMPSLFLMVHVVQGESTFKIVDEYEILI